MQTITRRNLVLSAAATSAVFGLAGRMELIPSAHAQAGGDVSPLNPKGLQFQKSRLARSR